MKRASRIAFALLLVFSVEASADGSFPIVCDKATTDSLSTFADTDTLTFSVLSGEKVYIGIMEVEGTPGFVPIWQLFDPSGTPVGSASSGRAERGPLDPPGEYHIEVRDDNGNAQGTYAINLQRLTDTPLSCDDLSLPCDSTITGWINSKLDTDLLSFNVSEGEKFFISVVEESGVAFDVMWRVLDGSGNQAAGNFTADNRLDVGPLTAADNPYRLHVAENGGNATGTYAVNLQRITATLECDVVPLPCDSTLTESIDTRIDTDLFEFSVADGEKAYLTVIEESGAGFDVMWRLLDASGNQAAGSFTATNRVDLGPLFAGSSPYRLHVAENGGNATGSYSVNLQRLVDGFLCDVVALPCDTTLTATVETDIDTDLFSFGVAPGEKFYVTVIEESGAGFDAMWRVLDKDGVQAAGSFTGGASFDRGPFPATGSPYTIHVAENGGDATGTYNINLQRLVDGFACDVVALPCDITITDTIETNIDTDLYGFDVAEGEKFYITVIESSGVPGFDAMWRVLDKDGVQAAGSFNGSASLDRGPFAATGSPYTIHVAENGANATGTYNINLQRLVDGVACDVVALPCDITITDTIETNIDTDLYGFDVAEGEKFYITVIESSGVPGFDAMWRVLDKDGVQAAGSFNGSASLDRGPFAATGSPYTIQVAENGANATGTYNINLQRLVDGFACDVVALPCDTTLTHSIETNIDTDLYGFDVTESERFYITVIENSGVPGFDAMWRVLDKDGVQAAGSFNGSASLDRGPFTATGSPYTIQVAENGANATGSYHVNLQRLPDATACEGIPLLCDTTLVETIDTVVDTDLFTVVFPGEYPDSSFSVPISVTALTRTTLSPMWRLLNASGEPASSCGGFSAATNRTCSPLSSGAPFRVQVAANGATTTGTYAIGIGPCGATSVEDVTTAMPTSFELSQNYPNPFSPQTTIEFALPRPGHVTLRVFNVTGKEVAELVNAEVGRGRHRIRWDATGLSSGIYLYRLETAAFVSSRKLVILQ